ncbi:aldolase/citrate lyase family protein [Roseomonas sp. CAU 1739]|uniref:HpcH/HpaI aldolase family protein n=1 Tax=Roseomonas sp. CAU 1739 TaxID=3140364 RepID=UPI00325A8E5D
MGENSPAVANATKRRLAEGRVVTGMMVRLTRTADIAVIAASCGFDALNVDLEHSQLTLGETAQICVSALSSGITPLVRVPSQDPAFMGRVLDGGAQGLIVPHVQSAQEAQVIAAATRFPPAGHRSMGGTGPLLRYQTVPTPIAAPAVDAETLITVMLETSQAVGNAATIAAVPGVDMVMIGTNDLCADMGLHGQLGHQRVLDAYAEVARACKANGKHLAIGGIKADMTLLGKLVALGARYISANTDMALLIGAARAHATELRQLQA